MVIKEQNVHLISTNRKALCNRSGRPNTCLITTKLKRAGAANNSYADGRTDGRAGIVEIRIDGRTDGRQLRPDTFFFLFIYNVHRVYVAGEIRMLQQPERPGSSIHHQHHHPRVYVYILPGRRTRNLEHFEMARFY